MKKRKIDFLQRPFPILNMMFTNVLAKIDIYKAPYQLTDEWIARVKLICETFIEVYEKITQNRATDKQQSDWFKQIWTGEPQGSPATAPPVFQTITLPVGAFIGIREEFREMIKYFKANAAYTVADGENLMIEVPDGDELNLTDIYPELKNSINTQGMVETKYIRGDFSGLELQWRVMGEEIWQLADKSTETTLTFSPHNPNPGSVMRIELRAIYLLKNQRVGIWSPIYSLTIS